MKSIFKISALALGAAVLLCGCKSESSEYSNAVSTQSVVQSANITEESQTDKAESQPTNPTVFERPSKEDDLLLNGAECGKNLTVYGSINNTDYSEYITKLEKILDNFEYNISLAVYALDNSKALFYNTCHGILGACTVKAPYSLYACMQMDDGNGSLAEEMVYSQKHYESGTGDMQYSPMGTAFTIETMLYKSMAISDNVGYLMSVDRFGRDGYNKWISSIGCDSLEIKPTVWSLETKSNDLAVAWREMYYYFNSGAAHADFLKKSCTNTRDNYATAALSNVQYSHKQGHNRSGEWHSFSDAGIVYKEGAPYIISVVTDSPGSTAAGRRVMADIIDIVHNDLF